jgi:phenylalanyl-tRNA synthetase alpha chain
MSLSIDELRLQLEAITTEHDFHQLKARYLGKKGLLTEALKSLSELSVEAKKEQGAILNTLKEEVRQLFSQYQHKLQEEQALALLKSSVPDPSLPGVPHYALKGKIHPISAIKAELIALFMQRGFDWSDGPDIETQFYNFEALNIPKDHPARQMHDTFYIDEDLLLRTHTSPVQIRYVQSKKPPIKMIAPGRVYRCDSDLTHTPMFHQIEGLVITESATLAELRALLEDVLSEFFNTPLPTRFRPSYFPFTDPSIEVDIGCVACSGAGCSLCKNSGFIEVLGCGMVHPEVLKHMGVGDLGVQGYAFGLGVERLAMLKMGVPDLRLFFENHLHFLQQF